MAREEQLREERRQRAEEARQLREEQVGRPVGPSGVPLVLAQDREYEESLQRDQRASELASTRREAARKLPAPVTKDGTLKVAGLTLKPNRVELFGLRGRLAGWSYATPVDVGSPLGGSNGWRDG